MSLVRRLLAQAALVLSGWCVAAPVPEVAAQPSTSENADRGLFGDGVAAADTRRPREPSAKTRVRPRVFALVIGSNATLDADLSPLRFADDDAARMTELLREVGAEVELATTLDADSQAIFRDLVGVANRPSTEDLWAAYDRLVASMQEAKDDGARVELLVYYSGHGDVGPDGQGYLTLEGGKLERRDLFARILERSPADHNHLIIDACKSEQFVLARGNDWKPDRTTADATAAVRRYLDENHLGAYPNTGVILAHSADQQTHEWDRYRGGIFTHELLSGLRGGADLNGDGRIEYSELGAFVAAANSAVTDPRARLQVVVHPPASDRRAPVLTHFDLVGARVLLFTGTDTRVYTVEDGRGVRVADLRRSGDRPGWLRLPQGDVFVQRKTAEIDEPGEETKVSAVMGGIILAEALSFEPGQRQGRGALDQAFRRGLFATPYGAGYYAGYTDREGLLGVADLSWDATTWESVMPTTPSASEAKTASEGEASSEASREASSSPWWTQREMWGSVFLGTMVTPFNPGPNDTIRLTPRRVTSDRFRGCLAPLLGTDRGCSALRGFDLRWQFFALSDGQRYPRALWFFRTGYTAGHVEFTPEDGTAFAPGDAEKLSFMTVPLFLGGNIYLFDRFPLRPFAGLGFGLDVLRVDYGRHAIRKSTDVSARVGFELHAGLEARITNYAALSAEVMQRWSARRKLKNVPDFSNEGFTVILGAAIGFPFDRKQGLGKGP